MIFLMMSTAKSQHFTLPSVQSLMRTVKFLSNDKIILIDNDGDLPPIPGVTLIRNDRPKSFAENANFGIKLSKILDDDVIILNNDIIFTPEWLDRLAPDGNTILIPFCNQNMQYNEGGFSLGTSMDFEDYYGKQDALEKISQRHFLENVDLPPHTEEMLMSFYCVYIPIAAARSIGQFDESFGRGGGEDVDYRLRAMDRGIPVKLARKPYLLHFLGKSTWRSGESLQETQSNDIIYRSRFVEKWGQPVADMFLMSSDKHQLAERYGVLKEFTAGDFVSMFHRLKA